MSRTLGDPEMQHFLRELQHTPAGRSYRRAWNSMIQAYRNMEHLKGDSLILNLNRRAYADASREASTALDVLMQLYGWPDKWPALPATGFIYQPPERAGSPPRKDP